MSYKKLQDETFPASLLMEFDELDDEFDVSPPALVSAERADSASGNRSPVLTSNSSSGNYSLSTENENGSGSSSCCTSSSKLRSTTVKRAGVAKDAKQRAGGSRLSSGGSSSSGGQKRAHSMENLRNGSATLRQQKYGHVKSKVKQFIDETVGKRGGGRHVLVRHKSMPDTNVGCQAEKTNEIDHEMDIALLRAMVKEKSAEIENLQRHLEFGDMQREDAGIKIESLKRKIEAMRLEESKRQAERDRERQRDQESRREFDRQMMLGAYLRFNRIFASAGTQTSPEACTNTFDFSGFSSGDSFDQALGAGIAGQPNASTGQRVKRTLQFAEHDDRDENDQDVGIQDLATHPESSPDYALLVAGRSFYPIELPSEAEPAETSAMCRECVNKKNKKLKKRARLASFFCIKKVD